MCGLSWGAGVDTGSLDTRCTVLLTKDSPCMVLSHCKCRGDHWESLSCGIGSLPSCLQTGHISPRAPKLPSPAGSSVPRTWGISSPGVELQLMVLGPPCIMWPPQCCCVNSGDNEIMCREDNLSGLATLFQTGQISGQVPLAGFSPQ